MFRFSLSVGEKLNPERQQHRAHPSGAISWIIQISYLKEWNQRPGHRRSDSIEMSLLLCIWIQLRAARVGRSPKSWIPTNLARTCFADEDPAGAAPRRGLFLSNEMLIVPSRVSRVMYNRLLACIKTKNALHTFLHVPPPLPPLSPSIAMLKKKAPFRRPHARLLYWISLIASIKRPCAETIECACRTARKNNRVIHHVRKFAIKQYSLNKRTMSIVLASLRDK